MLSLLFMAGIVESCSVFKDHETKKDAVENKMTVAAIRPVDNNETFIKIVFLESARFYKLPKDANPSYLEILKVSEKDRKQVIIKRTSEESDVILEVVKP